MSLDFCCDIQMVESEFAKEHKAWIHPALSQWFSCWWWCNGVGDIFLAHIGPLSTNWASFKSQPTWVVADMSIPLWLQCTHHLMTTSSRIMHHVTKLKSSQTGFLNMTMVHFTQMASTVTRSQSNRAPLGCGGTGDSHHGCAADKSAATVMLSCQYGPKSLRNVSTPCWIYAPEN